MYHREDSNPFVTSLPGATGGAEDDGELSQSLSQVRARRAIRLDSQGSLASIPGDTAPGGRLADEGSRASSTATTTRSVFHARDVNTMPTDAKQQRQQHLNHSRSRGFSAKSSLSSAHGQRHPSSRPPWRATGGASRQRTHSAGSADRLALIHDVNDVANEDTLMAVEGAREAAEATTTVRGLGASGASNVASPLPSRPPSPGPPPRRDALAAPLSQDGARPADEPTSTSTPPPRRAFVLSRVPSGVVEDDVNSARRSNSGAPSQGPSEPPPRGSLLLVSGASAPSSFVFAASGVSSFLEVDRPPAVATATATATTTIIGSSSSNNNNTNGAHPHRLAPGQVIEEQDHEAVTEPTPSVRAAAGLGADSDLFADSIMSPLPRPVAPASFSAFAARQRPPSPSPTTTTTTATRTTEAATGAVDAASTERKAVRTERREGSPAPMAATPAAAVAAAAAATAVAVAQSTIENMEGRVKMDGEEAAAAEEPSACGNGSSATHAPSSPLEPSSTVNFSLGRSTTTTATTTAAGGVVTADNSIAASSSLYTRDDALAAVAADSTRLTATAAAAESMLLVGGATPTPLRSLRRQPAVEAAAVAVVPPHESAAERTAPVQHSGSGDNEEEKRPRMDGTRRQSHARDAAVSPAPRNPVDDTTALADRSPVAVDRTTAMVNDSGSARSAAGSLAAQSKDGSSTVIPTTAAATSGSLLGAQAAWPVAANAPDDGPVSPRLSTVLTTAAAPASATPPPRAAVHAGAVGSRSPSASLSLSTPSSRISDEVRSLVARAQAEVRRTRDSLLTQLEAQKAAFVPTNAPSSGTGAAAVGAADATPTATATTTAPGGVSGGGDPRRLNFALEEEEEEEGNASDDAQATTAAASTVAAKRVGPSASADYFFSAWAAHQLRARLRVCAESILRRLRGYDPRDEGVLPMQTVVRVTLFVVHRRFDSAPPPAPVSAGRRSSHVRALFSDESLALMDSHATPAVLDRCPGDGRTPVVEASPATVSSTPRGMREAALARTPGVYATGCKRGRSTGAEVGSETCVSPTRTLERVMARQAARAAEEELMAFQLALLGVFRSVYGERYAYKHLGATNASQHDAPVTAARGAAAAVRPVKASAGDDGGVQLRSQRRLEGGPSPEPVDFRDVRGPLASAFPRLRQNYAPRHGAEESSSVPPLDVLVYYNTYAESLAEL